jgi:sterol desaturase/sphingolipid hydroxylase (fatty acid hydroxylase superfamily)
VDAQLFSTLNLVGLSLLLGLELTSKPFRRTLSDPQRMRRNLAFLLVSLVVGVLLHRSVEWLEGRLPRLEWGASLWFQLPGVFLLGELINWAVHYAKHKSAFLWRLHSSHHKEDQFTVWLTVHTYGPEILVTGTLMNAIILAAGFDAFALSCYLLFYSLINTYQHSSLPHTLGWLDKLIVNPAYHRHHHGGAQVNFGSTLTVWDAVFRTAMFPRDRREAVQPPAIEQTPEPFGFWQEMLYPWSPSRWVEATPPEPHAQPLAEPPPNRSGGGTRGPFGHSILAKLLRG